MPIKWRKQLIADERYEACGIFDVNGDGIPDIVSGAWWYEGPDFRKRHPIGAVEAVGEYFDDFSNIPLDVNGNGRLDYISGGWWSPALRWRENPGDSEKEWPLHDIDSCGSIERACAWDIDGDGEIEIVPNCPGTPLAVYKLEKDAGGRGTGVFAKTVIGKQPQGHGLGCGDIAGSGRCDLVLNDGWFEAPPSPLSEEWLWHPDFSLGEKAGVPILVVDMNGDGRNEIIAGGGHNYGLDWWDRVGDGAGARWVKHEIDPFNSQYHDLQWVDVDGDGECELVTGKRYRAHCGNDPGAGDDVGIYYFKWTGSGFAKQVIDYGPPRDGTGCGIYFAMADLTGNGLPDLVAPGKDGLYLFSNLGPG